MASPGIKNTKKTMGHISITNAHDNNRPMRGMYFTYACNILEYALVPCEWWTRFERLQRSSNIFASISIFQWFAEEWTLSHVPVDNMAPFQWFAEEWTLSHVSVQSKQKTCWSWERYRAPHECPCDATSTGVRWRSSV